MIWFFVLTSSLWFFWTDDSAVNMYILHSGNSLIWIQVIVNAFYLVNVKLTSVFPWRIWGIFRNWYRNTYLYSLLLSLQPLFPGSIPYLDGYQQPLRTVVDTCAAQLLYECQSELLGYFTELIQIRCTVAWSRVLTRYFAVVTGCPSFLTERCSVSAVWTGAPTFLYNELYKNCLFYLQRYRFKKYWRLPF